MPRPTRAKYCPECHAMNFVEAETCIHCGHLFRTGVETAPPSVDELHRTQMFTLPPLAQRPTVRDSPPPAANNGPRIVSLLAVVRASPLFPVIAVLVVVIVALLCWAVGASR